MVKTLVEIEKRGAAELVDRRTTGRKKLTVEVSPDLHARIVKLCSVRGKRVNEAVREVLERAFPA
jgi:predicted HicB family RNase H-like nuclease